MLLSRSRCAHASLTTILVIALRFIPRTGCSLVLHLCPLLGTRVQVLLEPNKLRGRGWNGLEILETFSLLGLSKRRACVLALV